MARLPTWYFWSCALLVTTSFLLGLGHFTAGHHWGGDFAQYIMQAQSIVDGTVDTFIDSNRWSMEASYRPVGPVAYPWGLPLLLAPLYAWFGVNLTAFKLVGVISFIVFLACYFRYVRLYHSAVAGLFLAALFALNPVMIGYLDHIASDMPFLLVSTATILLLRTRFRSGSTWWKNGIWVGLMIGMAGLLRSNGILLLIPLAAIQIGQWFIERGDTVEPRRHKVGCSLIGHASPWMVIGVIYGSGSLLLPEGGSSHIRHLESVTWHTMLHNLVYYIKLPLAFFEGVPGRWGICLLMFPLAILGGLVRLRSDYPLILYMIATMSIYVIWPDAVQGLRFIFPLLPFFLSFVVTGYGQLLQFIPTPGPRLGRLTGSGLAFFIVIVMGVNSVARVITNQRNGRAAPEGPYTQTSTEFFNAIRNMTAPQDHVVFFKPGVMRLMTGRPSTVQRDLNQVPSGAYVALYLDEENRAWPMEQDMLESKVEHGKIQKRYESERFAIYRVNEL